MTGFAYYNTPAHQVQPAQPAVRTYMADANALDNTFASCTCTFGHPPHHYHLSLTSSARPILLNPGSTGSASTLASASSKMDKSSSVTSLLRIRTADSGPGIAGPSIMDLNVRIWILKRCPFFDFFLDGHCPIHDPHPVEHENLGTNQRFLVKGVGLFSKGGGGSVGVEKSHWIFCQKGRFSDSSASTSMRRKKDVTTPTSKSLRNHGHFATSPGKRPRS